MGIFEPLKHYAEVHLKIEENPRGYGITFENKCHADDLTTGQQNLIKTHIFERNHHGLLTGSDITDVKITLLLVGHIINILKVAILEKQHLGH